MAGGIPVSGSHVLQASTRSIWDQEKDQIQYVVDLGASEVIWSSTVALTGEATHIYECSCILQKKGRNQMPK